MRDYFLLKADQILRPANSARCREVLSARSRLASSVGKALSCDTYGDICFQAIWPSSLPFSEPWQLRAQGPGHAPGAIVRLGNPRTRCLARAVHAHADRFHRNRQLTLTAQPPRCGHSFLTAEPAAGWWARLLSPSSIVLDRWSSR